MNGFLNALKYVLVLIVVVLGVGLIACGCLILVPGLNIFGLGYVSYDNKILEQQIESSEILNNYDKISINSGKFDVNVLVVDTDQILNGANFLTCRLTRRLSGFVVGGDDAKKVELSTSAQTDGSTRILNINVVQPQKAWLFPTTTKLDLFVPETLFADKNVEIISESGTVLVGSKPVYDQSNNITNKFVRINKLDVLNNSGTINLGCLNLSNDLSLTKEKGDINSYLDLAVKTTISIKSGFGNITLKNIGSNTNPKDLVLKDVWNAGINVGSVFGSLVTEKVVGGNIKIEKLLGESDITNDYADFHIAEVLANFKYKANDGLIEISKSSGKLDINQSAGSIKIADLGTNLNALTHKIVSNNAALEISKLHDSVEIESKNGAITVRGAPEDNQSVSLNIKAANSVVNLLDIDGSVSYRCDEGNSSIHTEYANFVGQNSYLNQSGQIEVVMPYDKNPPMWVKWETGKTASIKLFSYESTLKVSVEDPKVFVEGGKEYGISINDATKTTAEVLQIATKTGNISVYRKSVTQ